MDLKWKEGYEIRVNTDGNSVVISANKPGLLSLGAHLIALALEEPGDHIHYDEYNSLEEGSAELIVELLREEKDGE